MAPLAWAVPAPPLASGRLQHLPIRQAQPGQFVSARCPGNMVVRVNLKPRQRMRGRTAWQHKQNASVKPDCK